MDAAGIAGLGTPRRISRRLARIGRTRSFPVRAIGPLPTPERRVEDGWFMIHNLPEEWARTCLEEGFGEIAQALGITVRTARFHFAGMDRESHRSSAPEVSWRSKVACPTISQIAVRI